MRVGIIGAGQLGQMLGFAARGLDIECCFLDPAPSPPAGICGDVLQRPFDDAAALNELAASCDVVTYEFENVPVEALQRIQDIAPIYPPVDALRQAQDRLYEKRLFDSLAIALPAYHAIADFEDTTLAADQLGLPMVVKTRRLGYDGKGQFVVQNRNDVTVAWEALGGQPLIAEQWVDFDMEVSAIGVRNAGGDIRIYELTRNVHREGILRTSRAPIDAPALEQQATRYMRKLLEHLNYVGVLALELFVRDGRLLANEFAPRVHNSGHWTIEGAATSQFENHLRAITGLPLGPTDCIGHAGMINLIGKIPAAARALKKGQLHDYGKTARAGRKLGHITVVAENASDCDAQLETLSQNVN